jgi:GNAT superfamily N-acetyltransferase
MGQRPTAAFEEPVAAAILRLNPEQPAVAELAILRVVNNEEALERLLHFAWEQVVYAGCERIVGPTGILPGWQDGLLLNAFDRTPPLHTPYNPPYAPDLMAGVMEPCAETALWELPVPADDPANLPPLPAEVSIEPISLATLAAEHASLWQALWPGFPGLQIPSRDDLSGLAQELERWPTTVWLARAGEEAAGFVALQPDGAELLRTTGGGRSLLSRLWLYGRRQRVRSRTGRVVAGGVSPNWRGRGIGSQLWLRALAWARRQGWATLTTGPAPGDVGQGAALPSVWQARPLRHYQTYQWTP